LGGATTVNGGAWIEETPEFLIDQFGSEFATATEITAAYDWVREGVGVTPTAQPEGSTSEEYIQAVVDTFAEKGFEIGAVDTGDPRVQPGKVWRTYSAYEALTGTRRTVAKILDRNNANLDLRLNTEVIEILFDGDLGVPRTSDPPTNVPRARCVRLASWEIQCVKEGGRIYVAASAIHTPALLLRSGVGPNGARVDNPRIGENFGDKPNFFMGGNFQPPFDNDQLNTFANIAAEIEYVTSQGESESLLFQEFSYGFGGLIELLAVTRNNLPAFARSGLVADAIYFFLDFCSDQVEKFENPLFLCEGIEQIIDNNCDKTTGTVLYLSSSADRGSISLGLFGKLHVDVGYLSTDSDAEAFGYMARTAVDMLVSRMGPTALQTPCADPNDESCTSQSCPDLLTGTLDASKKILSILDPEAAAAIPSAPASVINPSFVAHFLDEAANDLELGMLLRPWVGSSYHYYGTAAMSKDSSLAAIDLNFKVIGAEGLYVSDASVLPQSPRVNTQATVMMMSRLAGQRFLEERN